jgi:hypothetical protein
VQLEDARVLVAGGSDPNGQLLRTTEVYDPSTETWTSAGRLHGDHVLPQLVATQQGAALLGNDPAGANALLETWDVTTSTWSAHVVAPSFAAADGVFAANGDLFVYSGARAPLDPLSTSRLARLELATRTVHDLPTPAYDRNHAYFVSLADDRFLVVTGLGAAIGAAGALVEYVARTSEIFDGQSWQPAGRLAVPHLSFDRANECLVALNNGDALIVAGSDQVATYTDVVERFSATTGRWARVTPLPDARDGHTTTRIPGSNDTILVIGGESAIGVHADGYAYDTGTDVWSPLDALDQPRTGHVAIAFSDGRVLVIGGANDASCELLE